MKYHIKINMKSHQTAYIIGFIVETDLKIFKVFNISCDFTMEKYVF